MIGSTCLPQNMQPLFWDIDWDKLDIGKNRNFIIERVLNMGDEHALNWLWQSFELADILSVVKDSRRLSKKTARCWQNYFGLKEDEMRCFTIFSMSPDKYC